MFTSMDVYDAASVIGRECQLIAAQYGQEALENLMPKLIAMLEELEGCALYGEHESAEITQLQELFQTLRFECQSRTKLKETTDMNLEQMELSYYNETQKLLNQVSQLEAENDRLVQELVCDVTDLESNVQKCDGLGDAETHQPRPPISSVVRDVVAGRNKTLPAASFRNPSSKHLSLAETAASRIALHEEMLSSIMSETEGRLQLTEQEDRVADLQLIGRLKECISTNYREMRNLNRELLQVDASLDAAEEEVCRLAKESGQLTVLHAPSRRQLDRLLAEQVNLESRLCAKEHELLQLRRQLPSAEAEEEEKNKMKFDNHQYPTPDSKMSSSQSVAVDSLVTLEELRHLLYERNELRCRLLELEEELKVLELENQNTESEVEGPMLPEPIDKLRPGWPVQTDIKTIFRQILQRATRFPSVDDA